MKLFSCAAIALTSAALISSLPAIAQMEPDTVMEGDTTTTVEVETPTETVIESETTTVEAESETIMPGETSMPPGTTEIMTAEPTVQPEAATGVFPAETITGYTSTTLPPMPPIQPIYFTWPITLRIPQDDSITSDTPITDSNQDFASWAAAVSSCMKQSPKMERVVGDESVPFVLNGTEGTIVRNANGKPVCPM